MKESVASTGSLQGLRAAPEQRHSKSSATLPGAPALLVLFIVFLLTAGAMFFWVYRLQLQQASLQDDIAAQVAEVLERMDLSGINSRASFEEVGLSLKALNDRVEELWKQAGETQGGQLSQGQDLDVLRAELQQVRQKVAEVAGEISVLGGLLGEQKDEISGNLVQRVQEAGKSAASLEEKQRQADSRLGGVEGRLERVEREGESVASYRRTTNQALIRLEGRIARLETKLAEMQELSGFQSGEREDGFP